MYQDDMLLTYLSKMILVRFFGSWFGQRHGQDNGPHPITKCIFHIMKNREKVNRIGNDIRWDDNGPCGTCGDVFTETPRVDRIWRGDFWICDLGCSFKSHRVKIRSRVSGKTCWCGILAESWGHDTQRVFSSTGVVTISSLNIVFRGQSNYLSSPSCWADNLMNSPKLSASGKMLKMIKLTGTLQTTGILITSHNPHITQPPKSYEKSKKLKNSALS